MKVSKTKNKKNKISLFILISGIFLLLFFVSSKKDFKNIFSTKATAAVDLALNLGMSEGSGAATNDSSGNGNNGTINGAAWVAGKYGSGLSFDGTNDYVEIADSSSLDLTNTFSIEAWIKPSSPSSSVSDLRVVAGKELSMGDLAYGLIVNETQSKAGLYISNGVSSFAGLVNIKLNEWQHVAVTYDGNSVKIYVNGVLKSNPSTSFVASTSGFPFVIGGPKNYDGMFPNFFEGAIDEVRVYGKVLTVDEIYNDYKGIVMNLRMSEGSGLVANDSSGNGNNGSINGAAWTVGKYESGLSFDGADDYVGVADSPSLDVTNAVSIEAWVKPNETFSTKLGEGYTVKYDANELPENASPAWGKRGQAATVGGGILNMADTKTDALMDYYRFPWGMVRATGATVLTRVKVNTNSSTWCPIGLYLVDSTNWGIVCFSTNNTRILDGSYYISYNTNNTEFQLYRTTFKNGLMNVYLNENPTPILTDTITKTYGVNALQFGSSEGTGFTSNSDWDYVYYDLNGAHTPNDESSYQAKILSKGEDAYAMEIRGGSLYGFINNNYISAPIDKEWHHVVQTYDGSSQKLYIDGTLKSEQALSGSIAVNASNIDIGKYLNGSLDEAVVYNRALTPEEIAIHAACDFNHGGTNWNPTDTSPFDANPGNGSIEITGKHCNIGNLNIPTSTIVNVKDYDGANYGKVEIETDSANIEGTLNASEKGYLAMQGLGAGQGDVSGSNQGSGGAHGGNGGYSSNNPGGAAYGSLTSPNDMGSGGGKGWSGAGGKGGGLIKLTTVNDLTVNGGIIANGQNGPQYTGGGGAGGSLNINIGGEFKGNVSGSIKADGGIGYAGGGRGGAGGGRISIQYKTKTFSGSITSYGGASGAVAGEAGGSGTIYEKDIDDANGSLRLDNNNFSGAKTPLTSIIATSPMTVGNLSITRGTHLSIDSGFELTASNAGAWSIWSLTNDGTFTADGVTDLTIENAVTNNKEFFIDNATKLTINSGASLTNNGAPPTGVFSTNINSSGSNGLFINGALTNNGFFKADNLANLAIPASGIFIVNAFSSVKTSFSSPMTSMAIDGKLSHLENPNTDTKVNFIDLSLANLTISGTGTIDVSGKGYASTRGPGAGQSVNYGGSGGGHGANGGYVNRSDGAKISGGSPYDSLFSPADMGSGGGGNSGIPDNTIGGKGGGSVRLSVSNNFILDGSIKADGANGLQFAGGGGAGGGVYINAGILSGANGTISANGGAGDAVYVNGGQGGGSGGRIAIQYETKSLTGSLVTAFGGSKGGTSGEHGGAGTVYEKKSSDSYGSLSLNNNDLSGAKTPIANTDTITVKDLSVTGNAYLLNNGILSVSNVSNLVIQANGTIANDGVFEADNTTALIINGTFNINKFSNSTTGPRTKFPILAGITIASGGNLSHLPNTGTKVNYMDISSTTLPNISSVTINTGGKIDVSGMGFGPAQGDGKGGNAGSGTGGGGGGAHGGRGGTGGWIEQSRKVSNGGIPTYGLNDKPDTLGSGGGNATSLKGGSGGGSVKLDVSDITINGNILANGKDGVIDTGPQSTGGGSGGSIWIKAATISGSGEIKAKGGNSPDTANAQDGGGGGGGRIAVYYSTLSAGNLSDNIDNCKTDKLCVGGGSSGYPGIAPDGGSGEAGTLYTGILCAYDHHNSDWPVSNDDLYDLETTVPNRIEIACLHYNINNLIVPASTTVYIKPYNGSDYGNLEVRANNITIDAGGVFNIDNSNTFAINTTPQITINGSLDNDSTGTVSINSGGSLIIDGVGSLTNNKDFRISNATTLTVGNTINNNGTFDLNSASTLTVNGSLSNSDTGEINANSGANFAINGTGAFTNDGVLSIQNVNNILTIGGNLINNGIFYADSPSLENIIIGGNLTNSSLFSSYYTKSLTINSGGTFAVNKFSPLATSLNSLADININGILSHLSNVDSIANYLNIVKDLNALPLIENVTVGVAGTIDVSGKGYRGGTTSSPSGAISSGGGSSNSNEGGGGAYGGNGGKSINNLAGGSSYGSITNPNDLGSGGGRGTLDNIAGAGGGLIRLDIPGVLTLSNTGSIVSSGGGGSVSSGGGGAGGAVYINTNVFDGNGSIKSIGGGGHGGNGGGGAGGRIAIYYTSGTYDGTNNSAYGGSGKETGGAGTIYEKQVASFQANRNENEGSLTVDNNNVLGAKTPMANTDNIIVNGLSVTGKAYLDNNGTLSVSDVGNLIIKSEGTVANNGILSASNIIDLTVNGTFIVNKFSTDIAGGSAANFPLLANITIANGGILSHLENSADQKINYIDISSTTLPAISNVTINAGGEINVSGKGYAGGISGPIANGYGKTCLGCNGGGASFNSGGYTFTGAGGGYGGNGGNGWLGVPGGLAYHNNPESPDELGSGGGAGASNSNGGSGGGFISLNIPGMLTLNGSIFADGEAGKNKWSGGGAGGAIYMNVANFNGSGSVFARGGDSGQMHPGSYMAGGGGGRIAYYGPIGSDLFDYLIDCNTNPTKPCVKKGLSNGNPGTVYVNVPPTATSLVVNGESGGVCGNQICPSVGAACDSCEPCKLNNQYKFSWTYNSNNVPIVPQKFYQIKIYDDVSKTNLIHNTGKQLLASQEIIVPIGPTMFNKDLYWELKVWDSYNTGSLWVDGPSFTTGVKYPDTAITCGLQYSGSSPCVAALSCLDMPTALLIEKVCFTNDPGTGSGNYAWSWDFGDGNGADNSNCDPTKLLDNKCEVIHRYSSTNPLGFPFKVEVTDNSTGKTCATNPAQELKIEKVYPDWQETTSF